MFMLSRDLQQDEGEDHHGPPDPHDEANFELGGGAPAWADPLDPLANFIKELEYLSCMSWSGPDISALVSELPVPVDGGVQVMLVDNAVKVACLYPTRYRC